GCTRNFYRRAADKEVNDILAEKDQYEAWKIEQWHVYPDPRARFADPTNPNRPPMPPDDPAAYKLAPHPPHPGHAGVGNIQGTGYLAVLDAWDAQNRADRARAAEAENAKNGEQGYAGDGLSGGSAPLQTIADNPEAARGFLLKMDQAVELGLINSR